MSGKKLSPTMLAMLDNIGAGRPLTFGISGRSALGAATGTRFALVKRGFIDGKTNQITETGREVLRGNKEPRE